MLIADTAMDVFLLLNRMMLGSFFILARFRWVYDPSRQDRWFNMERHNSLRRKLNECGFGDSWGLSACVAWGEILAGAGLVVGLFTVPSALVLAIVLIAAIATNSHRKVAAQSPVDAIAKVESFLWTPEPWMLLTALIAVVFGPGSWSVDALLWSLL